jgi:alpha-D-xyloside xylohydrolase
MRHPVLEWPGDEHAWAVDLEYGFGDALYVAPVVRRGMTRRSLWLPPGEWVDWWTLEPVLGGKTIERDAPLTLLPMWMRAGTIVPMLDASIDTLAPASSANVVTYDKIKGILDVRVVVSPKSPRASRVLVDGRSFDVSLASGTLGLPNGFATAAVEADLDTCASCGRMDDLGNGARRVRLSTGEEAQGSLDAGALRVAHAGSIATRSRWDVIVLP